MIILIVLGLAAWWGYLAWKHLDHRRGAIYLGLGVIVEGAGLAFSLGWIGYLVLTAAGAAALLTLDATRAIRRKRAPRAPRKTFVERTNARTERLNATSARQRAAIRRALRR